LRFIPISVAASFAHLLTKGTDQMAAGEALDTPFLNGKSEESSRPSPAIAAH
jgi:hypothetical protein